MKQINIIGAGLAGSEASYYLAKKGYQINLFEMRLGGKNTHAHHSKSFAELVCSNSLRAAQVTNAAGLLKAEMQALDSIIINSAKENEVPAGGALAVDREKFAKSITDKIKSFENIKIFDNEVTQIDVSFPTIVCSGPLTSDALSQKIKQLFDGEQYLHFFDAAAPIIAKESIDMDKVYLKSRYDKGEASYLNVAFTKEEYDEFYQELINAEVAPLKEFEKDPKVFEGCMPFEVMAKRGYKTLLFGPMKPVGLERPDGSLPYAVAQLRQDNAVASLYNIVGFQTNLKWGEQKRIIQMMPGLENADIVRYGVMHKNTFLNSPKVLNKYYQTRKYPNLFFAGQITGVEGYIESAASGIIAAINMDRYLQGKTMIDFTKDTVMGSQANYISFEFNSNFQPMNANFGIINKLTTRIRNKQEKNQAYADRSLKYIDEIILPELEK